MASQDSTGGTTPTKGKAVRAVTEVGGVRSSDDPVPDLWSEQPAEERRDATCSAEMKSSCTGSASIGKALGGVKRVGVEDLAFDFAVFSGLEKLLVTGGKDGLVVA